MAASQSDSTDPTIAVPAPDPAATASPAPEPRATGYSWYVLTVLVIVYILNFIDRQIVSILVVDIQQHFQLSNQYMGFLGGAAFAVFYALFGIPLGRLADNWGRTKLLSIGLALWSAMTVVSGFAKNGAMLGAARMGVGIGEATASPSAYSLISDYFPKKQRATALAIYSSGIFLGGGVSLFIGALITNRWNTAFPDGGPMGLVGWQASFLAVGVPGLLVALWVLSLREPVRGGMDGLATKVSPTPFADFFRDLMLIIPPLTLIGAAKRGPAALAINIVAAVLLTGFALGMIKVTGNVPQWSAVATGFYAVFSWASALRANDAPTFRLIWGSPAFIYTSIGYGLVAMTSYGIGYWSAAYAEKILMLPRQELAFYLGATGALGGFLGVIMGGRMADYLRTRHPAGRILVVMFGLLAPAIPIYVTFTTQSSFVFYFAGFLAAMFGSAALGAAAATTQDMVLPRMRGTATAAFFLATTLIGLAFGPYVVGLVSELAGSATAPNLRFGLLSLLVLTIPGMVLLIAAFRAVPKAEATVVARAEAAGEPKVA